MLKCNILKRGMNEDFQNYKIRVGEMAAVLDKHTIAFCFGENDVKLLEFDEKVTAEKADELIECIERFFAYNMQRIR